MPTLAGLATVVAPEAKQGYVNQGIREAKRINALVTKLDLKTRNLPKKVLSGAV